MKTQKDLINEYVDLISKEVWKNDPKMVDYVRKNIGYMVQLTNGDYIEIEKPRIEKNFCFGYMHDNESYNEAEKMSAYAKQSVDYFMEQNLSDLYKMVDLLKTEDVYTYLHYYNCPADSKIKGFRVFRYYADYYYLSDTEKAKYTKLDDADKQLIIDGYNQVIKDFEKRLERYLKKYGLSKIHTWTYWSEA